MWQPSACAVTTTMSSAAPMNSTSMPGASRILIEEGALDRVQPVAVGEPLDGGDGLALKFADRGRAGSRRAPVNEDETGTAYPVTTAKFGRGQAQVLAQHGQQAGFAWNV